MGQNEWLLPTIERLHAFMRYPDVGNEYLCKKVTPAAALTALRLLCAHMPADLREPRLVPTKEGGLYLDWLDYWVDCILEISASGAPSVTVEVRSDPPSISQAAPTPVPPSTLLKYGLERLVALQAEPFKPLAATPPPGTSP